MKVLYIAGLSHCGSTFTSRLLSQHSDIFVPGEVFYLHTFLNEEKGVCRCDDRLASDCPFWGHLESKIRSLAPDPSKIARMDTYAPYEWMKSLKGSFSSDPAGQKFAEYNKRFFQLLEDETEADIILDTSKTVWRLLPLYHHLGHDLKVLHIIKNPKNQIGSRLNRGMTFWKSALHKYGRRNFLHQYFFGDENRYRKLRFEKLAEDYKGELQSIYDWLDLDHEDPFEGEKTEWHHMLGYEARLERPDPQRVEKDHDFTWPRQLVVNALEALY